MSQTATAPQQPAATIPPAFRRTPVNPHSEVVKAGLQQIQQEKQDTTPQTPAVPPVQPVVPPVSPVQVAQPPVPPQAPAVPPAQPAVPPVYPPQAPQQITYDPRVMAALQQAEGERQRLAQENAAAQQTIANLLTAQQELDNLKQRQALQDSLSQDVFNDLGTVDPEDAKKISSVILNATAPAMTAIQKENEKLRQQIAESQQQMSARMEQQRVQQLNARLLQAHPDFVQLQNDPNYIAFMNQRDGLSSQTRDQRAAQEFSAGNVEYVIDMLNQLKGVQPAAAHIVSVAPVQTATSAVTPTAQPQAAPLDLRTLNSMYQMRQISHDEYRAKLKDLRAAQQM